MAATKVAARRVVSIRRFSPPDKTDTPRVAA
jgi:hypothetical protein